MSRVYDFIFVVLVYRNTKDLEEFFENFSIPNSKVIVVNSFFDVTTDERFQQIAENNNADFISVPNRGYGAGNNEGVRYALDNYSFKFLIISNADITIKQLRIEDLKRNVITAPKILTKSRKNQNPHTPYYSESLERLKEYAFTRDNRHVLKIALGANSLKRKAFRILSSCFNLDKIHAPHGAFIIIPYHILKILTPLFNPKMFLFAEEDHLAMKARQAGITCRYNPRVIIHHKEDGSVGTLPSGSQYSITKTSYLEYFNYWYNHG